MLKYCCALLLFGLVVVHAMPPPVPLPPRVRVGPFDVANTTDKNTKTDDDFFSPKPTKAGEIFEGDIEHSGKSKKNPTTAGGPQASTAGVRRPWPNGIIPYRFDCSVVNIPSAVKATREAMTVWEARTCVRFVEKRPQDTVYVEFIKAAGCWATYVGYQGKKTQVSIGNGCDYKHVMEHELGHVIGFWHEQSRPDRDQFININFGNVYRNLAYNFDKVREQTHNFGQGYDFASIMHYPFNAFAVDRRYPTIIPKVDLQGKEPYVGISDSDVKQTLAMYSCNKLVAARASASKEMKIVNARVGSASKAGPGCIDTHTNCPVWAEQGHCYANPDPMLTLCAKSCANCGPCVDDDELCKVWADYGYCRGDTADYMLRFCKISCSVCQPVKPTTKPTTKATTKATTKPTTKPTTKATTKATTKPTTKATTKATTAKPPTKATTRATPTTAIVKTKDGERALPTIKFTGTKCVDRSQYCGAWKRDGRCETDRWVTDNCLLSCKRYDICDSQPIQPVGKCASPLGVGWSPNLPTQDKVLDRQMHATSTFHPGNGWSAPATGARLYREDDHSRKLVGGWCAEPVAGDSTYLQIKFNRYRKITAVATQGRDHYFERVDSYYMKFSNDGSTWRVYEENGSKRIFEGNCDNFTPVLNLLENPQYAKFIRFYPVKYTAAKCLRVEVYGC